MRTPRSRPNDVAQVLLAPAASSGDEPPVSLERDELQPYLGSSANAREPMLPLPRVEHGASLEPAIAVTDLADDSRG